MIKLLTMAVVHILEGMFESATKCCNCGKCAIGYRPKEQGPVEYFCGQHKPLENFTEFMNAKRIQKTETLIASFEEATRVYADMVQKCKSIQAAMPKAKSSGTSAGSDKGTRSTLSQPINTRLPR